jgi:predicted dithiol-disulfide oxidoreductase (DUF899 family)
LLPCRELFAFQRNSVGRFDERAAVKSQREKGEYRKWQDQLLVAEVALKERMESVAALRKQLPMGPTVKTDYLLREGPAE